MSTLKDIRNRRKSVYSTKKITSAMKMIAAAKLRKAQDRVVDSAPYADLMGHMLHNLSCQEGNFENPLPLLTGTGKDIHQVFILITSDRGLCGSFNANVARDVLSKLNKLNDSKRKLKIICIGRRGRDFIAFSEFKSSIIEVFSASDKPTFAQATTIANKLLDLLNQGEMDICTVIYNKFISAISQKITSHQLMPYTPLEYENTKPEGGATIYEYEPSEGTVLESLLPKNLAVQLYRAMLENSASEHGARMTAMDSATRNANDMIKQLNLKYNRTRQALVTKELIEIISGAEAL